MLGCPCIRNDAVPGAHTGAAQSSGIPPSQQSQRDSKIPVEELIPQVLGDFSQYGFIEDDINYLLHTTGAGRDRTRSVGGETYLLKSEKAWINGDEERKPDVNLVSQNAVVVTKGVYALDRGYTLELTGSFFPKGKMKTRTQGSHSEESKGEANISVNVGGVGGGAGAGAERLSRRGSERVQDRDADYPTQQRIIKVREHPNVPGELKCTAIMFLLIRLEPDTSAAAGAPILIPKTSPAAASAAAPTPEVSPAAAAGAPISTPQTSPAGAAAAAASTPTLQVAEVQQAPTHDILSGAYRLKIDSGLTDNPDKNILAYIPGRAAVKDVRLERENNDAPYTQTWEFEHIEEDFYHIRCPMDPERNRRGFLSVHPSNHNVDVYHYDDGHGRQQWQVTQHDGYVIISVRTGVNSDRTILSCNDTTRNVDLWREVDLSGRQKWVLQKVSAPST